MSVRTILADVISFWKDVALNAEPIRRDYSLPRAKGSIVVVTGVRRAGKTYLLYQTIRELIEEGVPERKIFYVNFEDERILPRTEFLTELLPTIREMFSAEGELYLFLDEVHRIPGWDLWLNRMLVKGHRIFVSGSTYELQPSRIPRVLRGRTLTVTVYPLSFSEYLRFRGHKIEARPLGEEGRAVIRGMLRDYLRFGGFPEVVLMKGGAEKVMKLQEYFRTIMYRDIIESHGIRNEHLLEVLLKLMMNSTFFSSTKIARTLKSLGMSASKTTVMSYKRAVEDSYMMMQVEIFSYKVKDREQYPKKLYCADHGLRRAVSQAYARSDGRALENAVYVHLLRNLNPLRHEIHYYRSREGHEVDFVLLEDFTPASVIQVALEAVEEEVIRREERALIRAMKEFGLGEGIIVADVDYEDVREVGGRRIRYVPAWEFLLESPESIARRPSWSGRR